VLPACEWPTNPVDANWKTLRTATQKEDWEDEQHAWKPATYKTDADNRIYSIEDINKHCLTEFRKHWNCLENNNQQLWQCRPAEWKLNKCVFDNLVWTFDAPALWRDHFI
jgi:hypothetical protein